MINNFSGEYAFLSNFFPHGIKYDGLEYPTSEHAFQAAKTLDIGERRKIAAAGTPAMAKRMGRKVKLRPGWEGIKVEEMRKILRLKFADPDLYNRLCQTGHEPLVEGNYWGDTFWGVCGGKGKNWLGKLLMEIRDDGHNAPTK